tara:strand:+ start:124 stop:540 length:417 start_codon:yes stop_codon:yes gene_type:complete
VFNLIKWLIIFYLIKNCFNILRPVVDPYITNQTISDIVIFIATLIISYILLSSVNRIIIGIIQPKKIGMIDLGFGAVLGILRGYIVFVLLIFFINSNFSSNFLTEFLNNGSFQDIVDYGIKLLDNMPRELDNLNDIGI